MKNLGKEAKDKITGFEGVIIAKVQYLFGCNQYCIVPKVKDGEIKSGEWFDEGRIEIIGSGIAPEEVRVDKNGGINRDVPRDVK